MLGTTEDGQQRWGCEHREQFEKVSAPVVGLGLVAEAQANAVGIEKPLLDEVIDNLPEGDLTEFGKRWQPPNPTLPILPAHALQLSKCQSSPLTL